MIIIDKQRFVKHDLFMKSKEMDELPELKHSDGKLYAACLKDPFDIVCLLFYLRERSGSLLMIDASLHIEAAKELAVKAECSYLVYGNLQRILPINNDRHYPVPSLFQFSSGTTGEPKLISRSWQDIDLEIQNYNKRLVSSDQPIVLVPISHSYGLITGVLAGIRRETEPIIVHNKNPKFAISVINSNKKSLVYGVPFLYHLLDTLGKDELRYHKLISSGAPQSEALLFRLQERAEEVWQQYGCTEAGCISLGHQLTSPSDVGKPLNHMRVQVTTEDDMGHDETVLAANEIVAFNGSKNIYTRDLGYISDLGSLHVQGRMDDLINVSGLKVIPSEVERIIGRMRGVDEVVVYKTNHKVWGEAVKALVVSSKAQPEDVKAWCIAHLPAYKVPSVIEIVKEIPRLPSGKISRKLLFEQERVM